MKSPALFREYVWLVNRLASSEGLSLREINNYWVETEMSEGIPFSRTTFNRHRDAILDVFDVIIDCDRRNGYRYFIANKDVLQEQTVQNWMLSTLTVNNLVSEKVSLHKCILLENIPVEGERLRTVIDAMSASVRLRITYRRYDSDEEKEMNIEPYCIKLFRQRWYVLGNFPSGYKAVFSFDRILDMSLTDEHFDVDKDFDATEYFGECYGVTVGDGTEKETIRLRAFGDIRFYLRDLPLHSSQRIVANADDYVDYDVDVRPTADFIGQIMSYGEWLKILSPQHVVETIKNNLTAAAIMYEV